MSRPAPSQARQNLLAKLGQYALHAVLCAFFLFPLLFMFVSAFKSDEAQLLRDMNSLAAFLPQGQLSLDNFREVFTGSNFLRAFFNSLFTVSLTVVLGIIVNSMLAYALARFRFAGRQLLLSIVVALIIIPFEAIAVPLLLLANQLPWFSGELGWLDSYRVQIIPFIANAFSVYLFYQFFIALPKDLEEAALMDGAGRLRIYWSIVMPLSKPVIATVAVLQFLARWGDLLWPIMVVRGDTYATLPLAMQTFFGQFPRQWGDVMAFAAMATLPTLLVFLIFQRWFVRSAISSGVKG
ncbi:carbohydrate ABC transporter permease [Aquincola tertiaricarbonis]|uniref:sn-glycerol-3-phosphate transport system permease protein UgpE n=1 Tax=Aquincola tertiaricarbonis TaxID=391953 RepID=A0ABY4S6M5_AQUTE|nr:carbohydrate ABC transporter permease [Aquincola tertiaricarbonis]URI09061.1 carbohydrate ABC transporter permease [Aquincola tertiaricarbonis]